MAEAMRWRWKRSWSASERAQVHKFGIHILDQWTQGLPRILAVEGKGKKPDESYEGHCRAHEHSGRLVRLVDQSGDDSMKKTIFIVEAFAG